MMNPDAKKIWWVLIWLLLWAGCSGVGVAPKSSPHPSAYQYYDAARMQHDLHNYEQTLIYLQTAQALDPENIIFAQTHHDMRVYYGAMADHHFEQGMDALNDGDLDQARIQWMIALRYYPNFVAALNQLFGEPAPGLTHRTRPGDSPDQVAEILYGDPAWSRLVAFLYPPGPLGVYEADLAMRLPRLDIQFTWRKPVQKPKSVSEPKSGSGTKPANVSAPHAAPSTEVAVTPPVSSVIALKRAIEQMPSSGETPDPSTLEIFEQLFENEQFKEVIARSQAMDPSDPSRQTIQKLVNRSRIHEAREMLAAGRLMEARIMLDQIPIDLYSYNRNDERTQLGRKLEKAIQARAQKHFKQGLDHYVHERLDKAIHEWRAVLIYRPDHPQARMGIKNAQRLIEALKKIK